MNTIHHKTALRVGVALCILVILVILLRLLFTSAFFVKEDRINILFYSSEPIYYSLERGGEVHYVTTFNADSRTEVPGGYGVYRMGALGKLITLEKNPAILKRTFSRITGSMIDYYFFPKSEAIYYGSKENILLPSFRSIFLNESNGNIFDRLYIYLQFFGKHISEFEEIHINKIKTGDTVLLSDSTFARQYLGYFYHKSLRKENKTVQILYSNSYNSAKNFSRIIDGEGIRVVDIDVMEKANIKNQNSQCVVKENTQKGFSLTADEISHFFKCILVTGKGRVSDIVIEMGSAEKEWE
ncbi:MAG: hypothetical protein NTZ55_04540 [Candidatus Roizmanbacteria bacterium]|nr:hypothetical protein [Candidatus Roizmanbacteria bacterium]